MNHPELTDEERNAFEAFAKEIMLHSGIDMGVLFDALNYVKLLDGILKSNYWGGFESWQAWRQGVDAPPITYIHWPINWNRFDWSTCNPTSDTYLGAMQECADYFRDHVK